jgi:hypothetical protein
VDPEEAAVARQRLCKHILAQTNTHATMQEMLGIVCSMRHVSHQILKYVAKGE